MPRVRFTRKRPWLDRHAGTYRKAGDEIDVTAERAQVIVAAGVGIIVAEDPPSLEDGLDEMTVSQLREMAAGQGIDLGDARRKADIIEAIRQAREG